MYLINDSSSTPQKLTKKQILAAKKAAAAEQLRTHKSITEMLGNVTNPVDGEVINLTKLLDWDLPEYEEGVIGSLHNFSFDGSDLQATFRSPDGSVKIQMSPTQASLRASIMMKTSPNTFSFSPEKIHSQRTNVGLEVYGKSMSPVTTSSGKRDGVKIESKVSDNQTSPLRFTNKKSSSSTKKKLSSAFSPLMDTFIASSSQTFVSPIKGSTPHHQSYTVMEADRHEQADPMMSPTMFNISPTHIGSARRSGNQSQNEASLFDEDILNDLQAEWFPTGSPPPAIK